MEDTERTSAAGTDEGYDFGHGAYVKKDGAARNGKGISIFCFHVRGTGFESARMWKGRFAQDTSSLVQQFGESISYDWRLFPHDIAGSIAHARAQKTAGLLTDDEFSQIEAGLLEIKADIVSGNFEFKTSLEDIHMNIEAELTRRIGPAGAKLHTARSRNDQVATDTRLYCRTEIDALLCEITALQLALLDRAEKYAATIIPGYTHLQRGQPVTAGHHFLAYVEMLERDKSRLADCRKRLNISPLGSGALAGSTINLDRQRHRRDSDSTASRTTRWTPSPTATTSPSCYS